MVHKRAGEEKCIMSYKNTFTTSPSLALPEKWFESVKKSV